MCDTGKTFFLLAGHKVGFIARVGQINPFSDSLVDLKLSATQENIHFAHVVVTLAVFGHQTSPSQNKLFIP